eukprot:5487428-Pyramimonas_sp.AAC.1
MEEGGRRGWRRIGGSRKIIPQLGDTALKSGRCLWKIRPKFHCCTRTIDDLVTRLNPRKTHVFMDETFMGHISRLGRGCHPKRASLRILQRYGVFIAARWIKRQMLGRFTL